MTDDWSANRFVVDNVEMGSSYEVSLDLFNDGSDNRNLESVSDPLDVSKTQMNLSFLLYSLLNFDHSFLSQSLAEIETAIFEGSATEVFRPAKGSETWQLMAFLDWGMNDVAFSGRFESVRLMELTRADS
jgi:hypothetical protein